MTAFTIPGMTKKDSDATGEILSDRLRSLIDLSLTLKHVHWNVVGPHFIGVHEMLDPQVIAVRGMVDELAERIATLGGTPVGTPGHLVENRSWDDYALNKATVVEHLGALDMVYSGVVEDQRKAIESLGDLDPVSEDMVVGHTGQLELFQWFVRAHLENASGELSTAGAESESESESEAAAEANAAS